MPASLFWLPVGRIQLNEDELQSTGTFTSDDLIAIGDHSDELNAQECRLFLSWAVYTQSPMRTHAL